MSVQIRRRREAASFLLSYVGAQGELLVDTTNNRLQVHDGVTPGGWPAAKLSDVIERTAVNDATYTAQSTDRTIAYTALTAARIVNLPAATAYPTGTQLVIVDESGACNATKTLTIDAAGADTINGTGMVVLALAYGFVALASDGAAKWTILDQSTAGMAQQAPAAVAITGGTINGASIGQATSAAAAFTNASFGSLLGTAGTANKLALYGTTYGLGISTGSLDYLSAGAHSLYVGATKVGTVTGTGLNATAVGATTASTVRGTVVSATTTMNLPAYTVAALPAAATAGRMAYCSNARMVASGGTLEAAGSGTGGLVTDNGSAWKVAGTNITASA